MTEIVRLTALNIRLFTVLGVTDLPVPVTVAPTGPTAVTTNIHTIRKRLMLITKIPLLKQELVLI